MESLSTIARSVAGTLCAAVLVTSIPSHAYAFVAVALAFVAGFSASSALNARRRRSMP